MSTDSNSGISMRGEGFIVFGKRMQLFEHERAVFQSQFPQFSEYAKDIADHVLRENKSPFDVLQCILKLPSRYRLDVFLSMEDEAFQLAAVACRMKGPIPFNDRPISSSLVKAINFTLRYIATAPDYLLRDFAEGWKFLKPLLLDENPTIVSLGVTVRTAIDIACKSRYRTTRTLVKRLHDLTKPENRVIFWSVNETMGHLDGFYERVSIKTILNSKTKIFKLQEDNTLNHLPDFNFEPFFPNNTVSICKALDMANGEGKAVEIEVKEILSKQRLIELRKKHGYCLPSIFFRNFSSFSLTDNQLTQPLFELHEVYSGGEFIGILEGAFIHEQLKMAKFWDKKNVCEQNPHRVSVHLFILTRIYELFKKANEEDMQKHHSRLLYKEQISKQVSNVVTAREKSFREKLAKMLQVEDLLEQEPSYISTWFPSQL